MRLPLDFLFANENEASQYHLLDGDLRPVAIVHRGPQPTILIDGHDIIEVTPHTARPLDTTGAGDTFAAGFLTALATGANLVNAVESGHDAAVHVLGTIGPLLSPSLIGSARNSQIVV